MLITKYFIILPFSTFSLVFDRAFGNCSIIGGDLLSVMLQVRATEAILEECDQEIEELLLRMEASLVA